MKITNKSNLPHPLYEAVINHKYDPGRSDFTPSSLNAPPYQKALLASLPEELKEEDASDRIWAFLGSATHAMAEWAGENMEGYEVERRFYGDIEVNGKTYCVGAQTDVLDHTTNSVADFKVTSVWSVMGDPKPEWVSQTNVNRWCIYQETGQLVDNLIIIAILRDWSKGKAKQGGDYPRQQVATISLPVWSLEETEAWMRDRITRHEIAKATPIEKQQGCTPEETWESPTVYSVMKEGRKSSVRNLPTYEEASKLMEELNEAKKGTHYLEIRKGERKRCADYCAASDHCPAYKAYLENAGETNKLKGTNEN